MNHHFDVYVAKQYSVQQAIVLNHFAVRHKNIEKNTYFTSRGLTFFQVSLRQLCACFDYFSDRTVNRVIQKCIDDGLLKKACKRGSGFIEQTWYALSEHAMSLLNIHRPSVTNENVGTIAVDTLSHRLTKNGYAQAPALGNSEEFLPIICASKPQYCADQGIYSLDNIYKYLYYINNLKNVLILSSKYDINIYFLDHIKNQTKLITFFQDLNILRYLFSSLDLCYGDIGKSREKILKKGNFEFFSNNDLILIFALQQVHNYNPKKSSFNKYGILLSQCEFYVFEGMKKGFSLRQCKKGLIKLLLSGKFSEPRNWAKDREVSRRLNSYRPLELEIDTERTSDMIAYREYFERVETDIKLGLVDKKKLKPYHKWMRAGRPCQEPIQIEPIYG